MKLKIKKNFKNPSGVSSVEILMSVAILSLISIVILSTFFVTQLVWTDSLINLKLQEDIKKPMYAIIKELKEADPNSPTGISITNGGQSITFAVPATTSSTAITSWTQVTFSFDSANGQITRTSFTSTVIGRQIASLTFSQSNNIISVSITATGTTVKGKVMTTSLSSQAAMRK